MDTDNLQVFIVPICILGLIVLVRLAIDAFRLRTLQQLAAKYHLKQLTNDLPAGFPSRMLGNSQSLVRIRHAFSGPEVGDSRLVFDMRIGFGRGSYIRTVVARRFAVRPPNQPDNHSIWYREYGPWRIAYIQPGFFRHSAKLSPQRIEQIWNLLANPENGLSTSQNHRPAEILIHPRRR